MYFTNCLISSHLSYPELNSCLSIVIDIGMEKFDFLTKAIDIEASLPLDQAWSRASKKVGPSVSIASYAESECQIPAVPAGSVGSFDSCEATDEM